MAVFEVGKRYAAYDSGYDPILVTRRTERTIWVDNGRTNWMMRIRHDADGNEIAIDSTVPKKWRTAFTYSAKREWW